MQYHIEELVMDYTLTFEQYQQGLSKGKFLGLRCENCGTVTFPSLGVCRDCGGKDLEVTEMKGEGVIRTFTVVRVAPEGMKPPYVVAMVELDEGAWTMGNLVDMNPDEADMALIGRKVRLGSQVVKSDPKSEQDLHVLTFTLL
jgi:uncharacterized OB-fold protein